MQCGGNISGRRWRGRSRIDCHRYEVKTAAHDCCPAAQLQASLGLPWPPHLSRTHKLPWYGLAAASEEEAHAGGHRHTILTGHSVSLCPQMLTMSFSEMRPNWQTCGSRSQMEVRQSIADGMRQPIALQMAAGQACQEADGGSTRQMETQLSANQACCSCRALQRMVGWPAVLPRQRRTGTRCAVVHTCLGPWDFPGTLDRKLNSRTVV